MNRVPSIHITRTQLRHIINQLGPIDEHNLDEFMKQAKNRAITGRSVTATNAKTRDKVKKIQNGGVIEDTMLVSDILYAARVKLKHVGVKKITMSDLAWLDLKLLVPLLNDFCESQNMEQREGYILYISTGLNLLQKQKKANYQFVGKWLYQRSDSIISEVQSIKALGSDPSQAETMEIHDIYVNEVASRTGIYQYYHKDVAQMAHFIQAKNQAKEMGASFSTYIIAQFYALEFCNGIPRVSDLYGEKASQRLINYVSKTGTTLKVDTVSKQIDWSQFKD